MLKGRCILTLAVVVLCTGTRAWAHGALEAHEHADGTIPLAELFSGAAFLLSAAALWVAVRTRRLVESGGGGV